MSKRAQDPEQQLPPIVDASVYLFREIALGIFHQLANDLQNMGSGLHLIDSLAESMPKPLDGELRSLAREILDHVEHARGALQIVRERGRRLMPLLRHCSFVAEVVRVAVDRQARRRRAIRWAHSYTNKEYLVYVDRDLLFEAVDALLDNAAHAVLESKGTRRDIFIAVRAVDGDRVRLEIADTGVGIPPEIFPRLFLPFFTTRANGTGLGLYFARVIVETFRGSLVVERSMVGKGTVVALTLPLAIPA